MQTLVQRLGAAVAAAAFLSFAHHAAAAGPPLSAYTIFGENGVVIGFESHINGLVGARNNDPVADNNAVKLNQGASVNGDVRSGGNVNLQKNAFITGTLFRPAGTTLTLNFGSSVGTDAFPVDPMLPTLPAPMAFACPTGGPPLTGGNGQTLPLAAGTYGVLNFGATFHLVLTTTGDYFFDSINAGNGSTITVTQPGTRVFVCGTVFFGNVQVQTPAASPCDFFVEVHGSGTNAFQLGGGSNWIGDVFVPNGEIHVGSGDTTGTFAGRFFSNMVDIEHAITGNSTNCGSPPGNMMEFQSNKDATILHNRKMQNNGATKTLRVDFQTRSLVGFDVSTVDFSKVTKAELILTVSDNGFDVPPYSPSSGWPVGGGGVFVGRLFDGFETWAEGNGNNFPIPKNPRGTGSGVTWNCATDTNIANEKTDCSGIFHWKRGGRLVEGPLRGPAIQTDGMADGTKVVFDVTPDVQAGLGPLDQQFMTWFVERHGPGFVAYYSREGATAVGNPSFAPTLVITE
ncbi:MAG TPA: hypothetical protein VFD92_07650 [Candidatus Binatia bacterium]|nr:hypothetical protein [Candidatus Binatia bacterium]